MVTKDPPNMGMYVTVSNPMTGVGPQPVQHSSHSHCQFLVRVVSCCPQDYST
jgi:hypothetical protein